MRFAFTDDQLAFRDAVRDLLAKECPPEQSCATRGSNDERPAADGVWARSARWACSACSSPEARGRARARRARPRAARSRRPGGAALPEPFVEHAAVGAPLLADGVRRAPRPRRRSTATRRRPRSPPVPVRDADGAGARADGRRRSLLVARAAAVGRCRAATSVDGAPPARSPSTGTRRRRRARRRSTRRATVAAGASTGARSARPRSCSASAGGMLDLDRRVRRRSASSSACRSARSRRSSTTSPTPGVALEFARPLVYRAACVAGRAATPTRRSHVSMAKARRATPPRSPARQALQCHGAIGYTVEYDLHLWHEAGVGARRRLGRRRLAPRAGVADARSCGPEADR